MFNFLPALILAAAAFSKATPLAKRVTTDVTVIETFENVGSPPRFTPAKITSAGALKYGNIYVENPFNRSGVVPYGMRPSSGSYLATYFNTLNGLTPVAPAAIIKSYPVVTGYTFDLLSWKYGCAVGLNGVALAVSRCYVAAFGYRAGQRVARQLFSFLPTSRSDSADLVSATFNSNFTNIDTVRLVTVYSPALLTGASKGFVGQTAFDDLEYTSHHTPNFTWPIDNTTLPIPLPINGTGLSVPQPTGGVTFPNTTGTLRFRRTG